MITLTCARKKMLYSWRKPVFQNYICAQVLPKKSLMKKKNIHTSKNIQKIFSSLNLNNRILITLSHQFTIILNKIYDESKLSFPINFYVDKNRCFLYDAFLYCTRYLRSVHYVLLLICPHTSSHPRIEKFQ